MNARQRVPVFLLLLLHGALLLHSVWHKSSSVDELGHLAAGLYDLDTGDFRCNRLSPPFQNIVCAIPVKLFGEYRLTFDHECWRKGIWNGLGERFVDTNPETFQRDLLIGRTGTMVLSILLCWLIFVWAEQLWGYGPALGVLTLSVLEPNFLAHGRLATTDTAPTLFFLLTGFLVWRFMEKPSVPRLIGVGVAFGLTWYSKHSGPVLLPALFLTLILWGWFDSQPAGFRWLPALHRFRSGWRAIWLSLWLTGWVLAIGLLVIWAGYGFEIGDRMQPPRLPKQSSLWQKTEFPLETLTYLLGWDKRFSFDEDDPRDPYWRFLQGWLPAFSHWEGFIVNQANAENGASCYFLGSASGGTCYSYYPVLFLVKTPVAILLLYLTGAAVLWMRRIFVDRRAMLVGFTIPLVYAVVLTGYNQAHIGYRHALPIIPFLLVFLAGAAFRFLFLERKGRETVNSREKNLRWGFAGGMLLFTAVEVLSVHPHYLAYFNRLAGGPEGGQYFAVDSNLDWGQDLLYLKDYLQVNKIKDPYLFYFGPQTLPEAYGIHPQKYVPQRVLQSGTYIVSVSLLRQYITSYDMIELLPLVTRPPDDIIAHTLFVFHIPKNS